MIKQPAVAEPIPIFEKFKNNKYIIIIFKVEKAGLAINGLHDIQLKVKNLWRGLIIAAYHDISTKYLGLCNHFEGNLMVRIHIPKENIYKVLYF